MENSPILSLLRRKALAFRRGELLNTNLIKKNKLLQTDIGLQYSYERCGACEKLQQGEKLP